MPCPELEVDIVRGFPGVDQDSVYSGRQLTVRRERYMFHLQETSAGDEKEMC